MAPRPKFTIEQLQMTALEIVDEKGLAALSMRQLATRLGTAPMTIYNYVRDRDDLDGLVVEAAMAKTIRPAGTEDWRDDIRSQLEALWISMRAHPEVVPLILARRTRHEITLEWAENVLKTLARGGRSGVGLLYAFRVLLGFVMGLAQMQLVKSPTGLRADHPDVKRTRALPKDRFSKLVEIGNAAAGMGMDDEFYGGLEIILDALGDAPKATHVKKRRKQK